MLNLLDTKTVSFHSFCQIWYTYLAVKGFRSEKVSNPIFVHDTLAHDVALPYQIWLQRVQRLRRYCLDEHSLEFWTFSVTLPLPWPQQTNPIFSQDNPPHDDVPSSQVYLQKDQQFRWYINKSYFDYIILNCDLDLEERKPIFLKDNLAHNDASPYTVW